MFCRFFFDIIGLSTNTSGKMVNHLDQTKLVITGMGAVTPIGVGVPAYWQALTAGTCGIGRITRFDVSDLPVQIAAELRDFDPAAYMPKTLARTTSPHPIPKAQARRPACAVHSNVRV